MWDFFTSRWLAIQIDVTGVRWVTFFLELARLFDNDRCSFMRGFFYEPLARNTN